MPHIQLRRLTYNYLYLSSFATYAELKAAKEQKSQVVGFAGKLTNLQHFQIHRWLHEHQGGYRNYALPENNHKITGLTSMQSLQTALAQINGKDHEYILIWQGSSIEGQIEPATK